MKNTPFNVMRHNDWDRAPRGPAVVTFVGSLIFGGGVLTATQLFVAGALVNLAVTAVTSWALQALAPKPTSGVGTQGLLTNARNPAAPHEYVYGEVRKGGVVTYLESTGDDNKTLHQIIVLAGHAVEEIGDIFINDEVVTLETRYDYTITLLTGNLITRSSTTFYSVGTALTAGQIREMDGDELPIFSPGGTVASVTEREDQEGQKVTSGPFSGQIFIEKFLGDQVAPPASLLELSVVLNESRDGNPPAAANFVGNGLAYIYVRLEYDQDVFANGIPLFTAKVKGKKVFDPRTSTTSYSANAALCIRDYLVTDYGMADVGSTNDTVFSAAANVCDEDVDLATAGVQPRYEMNGVISAALAPGDILQSMMTSCAGTLFWGQGKWQLRPGFYTAPTKTLTLDDLRGPISLSTRTSRRDNFNIVRGKFNDAAQRYITSDYTERRGEAFIIEDNNLENALDLELPLTTSAAMAQRLAKLTLFRGREQMSFSADFSMAAFDVQVGDIIALTNSRYGFNEKEFEVLGWRFAADGDAGDLRVNLSLRETSEAAFDWNAEESAIISNNTNLPSAFTGLDVTNLTISGGGRTQSDGTFVNAAILSWTAAPSAFVDHYQIEYRPVADSNFASTTTVETTIEVAPVIDAIEYAFRVRAVSVTGVRGPFTSATFTVGGDVTAPGLPTSFAATGNLGFIDLSWVSPSDVDLNYTEIFESPNANFASAVQIARAFGNTFNRGNLAPLTTRFYFVRSVDFSDNKSAFVGPVNATTRQIQVGDIGPAVIQYDDFASDVTDLFDDFESDVTDLFDDVSDIAADVSDLFDDVSDIIADVSDRVLTSDYNITVGLQQQLEDATTQLATDALTLALNASSLESRVNDAGITIDPATGSVVIQGLSAVEGRVNTVEIDLNAVESELTLKASTTFVNDAIAAATLPEATLASLEDLEGRVDEVEIDLNAVEGSITLTSTGSLYNVNDGVLGVEALEGRITVNEGEVTLKASQTELDDVETRLGSAEFTLNALDVPSITLAVQDVRTISNKQDDLGELTLQEVLGRYNDREYVLRDVAFARQELTADVNEQGEAIATLTTELQAQINDNVATILSEQQARATADSALAFDITQLEASLTTTNGNVTGNATAISGLEAEVTSLEGVVTAQASDITQLESSLASTNTNVAGNATAISGLDTRVTSTENSITAQSSSITSLQSDLSNLDAEVNDVQADTTANATAISGLDTRVTSTENSITAQSSSITSLQSDLSNLDAEVTGVQTDTTANATAISGLNTRVTSTENSITAQSSSITSLQSDLSNLDAEVTGVQTDTTANATAISGLNTRVTTAEGNISSQSTSISSLSSSLSATNSAVQTAQQAADAAAALAGSKGKVFVQSTAPATSERLPQNLWIDTTGGANTPRRWNGSIWEAVTDKIATDAAAAAAAAQAGVNTLASTKADATAVSALTTRVTTAEGNISSQASQITSLSTTVGNNTTSITQAAQSIDGIEGKFGVTIDNNGAATGFQLLSGAGGSAFNVRADQFAVFNSTGAGGDNPFTVFTSSRTIGGVVYPAGTYIRDAFIDNAAIVNGSIDNAKIVNGAITSAKIGTAEIKTANIENGAVTNRFAAFTAGSLSITTSYQLAQSLTIDADGNPVSILFNAGIDGITSCLVDIRVDGASQRVFTLASGHSYAATQGFVSGFQVFITSYELLFYETMGTAAMVVTPAAGSRSVQVYVKREGGRFSSPIIKNRFLETTELKR